MDQLDQAICEKRQELEELSRKTELARAHLEGLLTAANLRPELHMNGGGSPLPVPPTTAGLSGTSTESIQLPRRRGGRTHGTITGDYKRLVGEMVARGNSLMDSFAISVLAREIGLDLSPKRAGDRLRKYSTKGVAERVEDRYRISQATIQRYGFAQKTEPSPEGPRDGSA